MPNKKISGILLAGLLLIAITGLAGAGETKSIDVDHFHLEWMVDGDMLQVEMSAPVEGWVAVGFDPSNKMKDANIIIGYVEDGTVMIEDHYGSSAIAHREDSSGGGRNDIVDVSGSESNGTTTVSFSIPLDSGDSRDRPLMEGETYKVIFASSSRDSFSRKHKTRTSVEIVL